MAAKKDRNGLIVLDRQACLERLARRRVGTIALTERALPVAVPTVYALFGTDVVLSADPTSLLGRRLPDAIVSLCVQDVPDDLAGGWNITVTGHAVLVNDPTILDTLPLDRLPSWGHEADGRRAVVARLGTERITGREVPGAWGPRSGAARHTGP